ncbi:ATP-binding protein [Marinobacterium rhizophilum]|uniref:histidine kinase n=1 Tax=Marinobacterium rhizophilum TaxID=420402 RepID=A0ABY5HGF0_9GAMM|nr:ATP-binding protein [Marinobacterium rhizophilum]UTW10071.1 response regulator [Marinobacterium rhizophilum]
MSQSHTSAPAERPRSAAVYPRAWPLWLRVTLLAIAYWATGQLSIALALPPGLAAPVWLPAGIALAGMLMLGSSSWPGVWLGAFVFSVLRRAELLGGEFTTTVLGLAAAIALGATLQALVASRLIYPLYRAIAGSSDFESRRSLVYPLVLGVPLSCMLSAAIGSAALGGLQHIPVADLAAIWMTWWAGDCLGMLLVVPLLFAMAVLRQKHVGSAAQLLMLPWLTAGILVSGYYWLARSEQAAEQQRVETRGAQLHEQLRGLVAHQEQAVITLADFVAASSGITRLEFAHLTRRAVTTEGISWLGWAPRVSLADRIRLEQPSLQEERSEFIIIEPEEQGAFVPASSREQYFPLRFVTYGVNGAPPLGLDLGFAAGHGDAIQRAIDRAQPVALLSSPCSEGRNGRLLFIPVYPITLDPQVADQRSRRDALQGVVAGCLTLQSAPLARLMQGAEQEGLALRVMQKSGPNSSTVLFERAVPRAEERQADWAGPLDLYSDDSVVLEVWSLSPWQPGQTTAIKLYLAGAVLAALFAFMLVLMTASQTQRVRRQVERRTAELDEAKAQLRRVIDGSQLGYWDVDLARGRLTRTGVLADIFGPPVQDMQAASEGWGARMHPEDRACALAQKEALAQGLQDQAQAEFRLRLPSGDWHWFHVSGSVVSRDAQARPLYISGVTTDIHDKKQLELALRESEKRLVELNAGLERTIAERTAQLHESEHFVREVLDTLAAHIVVLDESGVILATNRAWRLFARDNGMAPEQVGEGVNYLDSCERAGQEGAQAATLIREVMQGLRAAASLEYSCPGPDEERWFLCRITRFAARGPVRVVLAHENITERVRAEHLSRDLAGDLQATLQAIPDPLFDLDEKGVYHQVWSSGHSLLARRKETLVGMNVSDVLSREAAQAVGRAIDETVRRGQSRGQQICLSLSGGERWFDLSASAKRSTPGKALRVIMLARDITDRKRAEEALEQLNESLERRVDARTQELTQARRDAEAASRVKSDFLATMSHEIRTPLNGVIGMVDVLEQSRLQPYQLDMVELIRDSGLSLLHIIDDILDLSKIEAGHLVLESEPFQIAQLVEKTCAMLDAQAAGKGVELTLFTDPALPDQVLGDELRLRQILLNLASNAIKFSAEGNPGRVSVRMLSAGQSGLQVRVKFQVADNGIGMDAQTQAGLFTAFKQADSSTTRRFGGTGLGLAISQHLVSLMQGDIQVASEPDKGAVFTVTVPLLPVTSGALPEPSPVAGLRCLVIGAENGLATDIATYLVHGQADVWQVADIASAHDWVKTSGLEPELWILDVEGRAAAPSELGLYAGSPAASRRRYVLIERGQRRQPRPIDSNCVTVDGNVLSRQTLMATLALALANGQLSPDETPPSRAPLQLSLQPPTRLEALQQGRLILVAEDNLANQKVLSHQLAMLGYYADMAADGTQALALWCRGNYALLLTDLHMPEMDGYQLTAAIRDQAQPGTHRPIVALTANALKGEARRCVEAGMDDYLSKPARLEELQAMLEKWMPAQGPQPAAVTANANAAADTGAIAPTPAAETAITDTPATAGPVDTQVLASLVGDSPDIILEFLQDFRTYCGQMADQLLLAWEGGKVEDIGAVAHKLKSSALSIGASPLANHCLGLESAAGAQDLAVIARLIPLFQAEMAAVARFIDNF